MEDNCKEWEKCRKREKWCEKSSGKEITFLLAIETIDLLGKNTEFVFQDRSGSLGLF